MARINYTWWFSTSMWKSSAPCSFQRTRHTLESWRGVLGWGLRRARWSSGAGQARGQVPGVCVLKVARAQTEKMNWHFQKIWKIVNWIFLHVWVPVFPLWEEASTWQWKRKVRAVCCSPNLQLQVREPPPTAPSSPPPSLSQQQWLSYLTSSWNVYVHLWRNDKPG